MTATTNDSLAKAVAYLGAVEVAKIERAVDYLGATEIEPDRYAYFELDDLWHVVNGSKLEPLAITLRSVSGSKAQIKAHRIWRAGHFDVTMPAWWTPEQRFAWRIASNGPNVCKADRSDRYGSEAAAKREAHFIGGAAVERITANLETGAEVPA